MTNARVIVDSPADGAWNMAVDHALLESANKTGRISVRFYSWANPTLTLGYFQKHLERNGHQPSQNCTLVRRSTGGGAILHDQEITYSLCVPSSNRWSTRNEQLYFMMHELILKLLSDRGVDAQLFDGANGQENKEAFLCFHRRTQGDVVLDGNKIGGSAQRRKKNALLQHGSLLIRSSEFAPGLKGIEDIADGLFSGQNLDQSAFITDWIEGLQTRMGVDFHREPLAAEELDASWGFKDEFYSLAAWTEKR